ncbi:MAG: hypothetical protein KKG59_05855 [Nanoarchaeota archaeon]|nr:hypothetical protein [Nanoarchaeota archaeon]
MKQCHNISVRVFARQREDTDRIKETLVGLFLFDLEKEKVKPHEIRTKSADEKTDIFIYEISLNKDRLINKFLGSLNSRLNADQKALLLRQENRLDQEGNFFIRLDKPRLLEGIFRITDSGNCFHIRMCIAAYPKTRDACLAKIREIFKIDQVK